MHQPAWVPQFVLPPYHLWTLPPLQPAPTRNRHGHLDWTGLHQSPAGTGVLGADPEWQENFKSQKKGRHWNTNEYPSKENPILQQIPRKPKQICKVAVDYQTQRYHRIRIQDFAGKSKCGWKYDKVYFQNHH